LTRHAPAAAVTAAVLLAALSGCTTPSAGATRPAGTAPPAGTPIAVSTPSASARVTPPPGVPAPPRGWTMVFGDGFTGPAGSGIDSQWRYDTGPGQRFGTGEVETMTDSAANVRLDGHGHLDITARKAGGSWTSGRVQTASAGVGAPAGGELEVTASIEQPDGGLGYWPAFWMVGQGRWPESGEIDIMEDVDSLPDLSGTVHCGSDPGGPCGEPEGIGSYLVSCGGCRSGYHTYTMILDRRNAADESIAFYLDGHEYYRVTESRVGAATWRAAFDHPMSIVLDLAMGGAYPDEVCDCTSPAGSTAPAGTMSVAYVAAYATAGG
jgi:beta-glucanase (GH16 family)